MDESENLVTRIPVCLAAYFDIWNTRDPGQIKELVDGAFDEDVFYKGDAVEARGSDEITSLVALYGQQEPYRHSVMLQDGPIEDAQQDRFRYKWKIVTGPRSIGAGAGVTQIVGVDITLVTAGLIQRVDSVLLYQA